MPSDAADTWVERVKRHPIVTSIVSVCTAVILLGELVDAVPSLPWGAAVSAADTVHDAVRPEGRLAYVQESRLALWDARAGTRTLLDLPSETTVAHLAWSSDGRRVAALVGPEEGARDAKDEKVWYRDLETSEEGEWPCPGCRELAFVGPVVTTFAFGEGPAVMHRFALDGRLAAVPVDFPGPGWLPLGEATAARPQHPPYGSVIGATGEEAIVALPDYDGTTVYGGPQVIYGVSLDGQSQFRARTESLTAVRSSALREGGRELAVVYSGHASACDEPARVAILNTVNDAERQLPSPDDVHDWSVLDVEWSPAGGIFAVMAAYDSDSAFSPSGNCDHDYVQFEWVGDDWRNVEQRDAVRDVEFSDRGTRAELRYVEETGSNQLWAEAGLFGRWTYVDSDVRYNYQWAPEPDEHN